MNSQKPSLSLADMYFGLIAGGPAMILDQESRGQKEAISSGVLPRQMRGMTGQTLDDVKGVLQSYGVIFEDQLPKDHGLRGSDDLFQVVLLPPGWKTEATSHSMWNNLVDDRGLIRATYFYKGAFYDRDAFLNLSRRLRADSHQDDYSDRESPAIPVINDGNKIVWRGTPVPYQEFKPSNYMGEDGKGDDIGRPLDCPDCGVRYDRKIASCETCGAVPFNSDVARHVAQKVLEQHYPNYSDPTAYWDVETLELPESESVAPEGSRYNFYVSIYQNRNIVDSGCNSTLFAKTVQEAEQKAQESASKFGSYDRVDWRLVLIDDNQKELRQVANGSWEKPKPKMRFARPGPYGGIIYEDEDGNPINKYCEEAWDAGYDKYGY